MLSFFLNKLHSKLHFLWDKNSKMNMKNIVDTGVYI